MTKLSAQREPLWERCKGQCEVSGRTLDYETFHIHHRRNKGMGGTSRPGVDELWNLLALDPIVHNGGPNSVHAQREWAEIGGYLIPKHRSDAEVMLTPIVWHGIFTVLLGNAPRYFTPPSPLLNPTADHQE